MRARITVTVVSVIAAALPALLGGTAAEGQAVPSAARPAAAAAGPGWIVEGPGNQNALAEIRQLAPSLATAYFDNARTVVLAGDATPSQPPRDEVPAGWPGIPAQHYTAYGPCTSNRGCASFTADLASGALAGTGIRDVMYDDENWSKTPGNEKQNVCSFMDRFARLAHANGFGSIMAPDQNLASPGVLTSYQGGESENWQTYLRLGLARCAARSGTDRYHVMSQPYETHWCGGQGSACEGSEADFDNFVTQAALQARAVSPDLGITAGLTTNHRYNATPQALYQDSLDVAPYVNDGFWLNVAGRPHDASTAVQYLEMRSGLLPFYLTGGGALSRAFPLNGTAAGYSLSAAGAVATFVSGSTLPAGTAIPAGTYTFEPWTDGSSGSATLGLEVGYCTASRCHDRWPIIGADSWHATVRAGDPGVTTSFKTASATTLPPGGPYHLYLAVHVVSPGPFDLLSNTHSTSTNLAVPRPSADGAHPGSSVLFARRGGQLSTSAPAGQLPESLNLAQPGNTATFVTGASLPAGAAIPAGTWQFQGWTNDGTGAATVRLQAGYCAGGCRTRTPVTGAGWQATVTAGSAGSATPGGAYTTSSATRLPASGGPYHLYWTLQVVNPGPVGLQYGSSQTATNVATPVVLPAR